MAVAKTASTATDLNVARPFRDGLYRCLLESLLQGYSVLAVSAIRGFSSKIAVLYEYGNIGYDTVSLLISAYKAKKDDDWKRIE